VSFAFKSASIRTVLYNQPSMTIHLPSSPDAGLRSIGEKNLAQHIQQLASDNIELSEVRHNDGDVRFLLVLQNRDPMSHHQVGKAIVGGEAEIDIGHCQLNGNTPRFPRNDRSSAIAQQTQKRLRTARKRSACSEPRQCD